MTMPRYLTLGLLALTIGFTASAVAQTADPAQIIRERREGLRAAGANLEALQAIAASRGDPRPGLPRIEAIATFFTNFPDRFPPNTQAGETRAQPAVFTDRAGFVAAYTAFQGPLANLQTVAAAGDSAAFPAALQQLGASCGNCHRAYRAR
jgi:cytochrome c556